MESVDREQLLLETGRLATLLKRLEPAGFVKRIRNTQDEKNRMKKLVRISLSESQSLKAKASTDPNEISAVMAAYKVQFPR